MKRIILTVTILLLSSVFAWAEISGVPQLVNYQGKLTDANGEHLSTAEYKLVFNIYDDATGGSIKWGPQTFESVPVVRGYFNVILGPVDTSSRSIMDGFSGPNRYLGIKINDGTEIQPRQQVLSAPYAMAAGEVSFEMKNTDWGRIFFESTGDGVHESNVVFETYDNQDEGFIFRTTGVERARIDNRGLIVSSGNVGIGTTSPTARLDVQGDIKTNGKKAITECRICFQQTEDNPQCWGKGEFCSGWSSNPSWSDPFYDDTDGREGGCKYQWKIECR